MATTTATRILWFIVAATLIPALGLAIGSVGRELANRAAVEQEIATHPVAHPSADQARALTDTAATVPPLGIEWRWAELDVCGRAFLRARVVLLDPDMSCDLQVTVWHEWAHIAEVDYYGGDTTPGGQVTSDLIDEETGRPYVVDVQEIVADCISVLIADEMGAAPKPHSYLQRTGGCDPGQLALARDIATSAGVRLSPGTGTALNAIGSGVA